VRVRSLRTWIAGTVGTLALTGCQSGPGPSAPPSAAATACPFAPAVVRIHPLTHVDAKAPGVAADQCLLVLHLELRDRFGDAVKGVGRLKVELYKPGSGIAPGIETQAIVWDVPAFAEPDSNSSRFDPSTRTYRLPLITERWVAQWLTAEGAPQRAGSPAWLKVRALLDVGAPDQRPLTDEFIVQP